VDTPKQAGAFGEMVSLLPLEDGEEIDKFETLLRRFTKARGPLALATARDDHDRPLIWYAVDANDPIACELLLSHGAASSAFHKVRGSPGAAPKTPFEHAYARRYERVARVLNGWAHRELADLMFDKGDDSLAFSLSSSSRRGRRDAARGNDDDDVRTTTTTAETGASVFDDFRVWLSGAGGRASTAWPSTTPTRRAGIGLPCPPSPCYPVADDDAEASSSDDDDARGWSSLSAWSKHCRCPRCVAAIRTLSAGDVACPPCTCLPGGVLRRDGGDPRRQPGASAPPGGAS